MNQVIYTSPYVPAEWITSFGLSPSRVLLGSQDYNPTDSTGGTCPFVSRYIQETGQINNSSLFVFTTECDQMRRGFENPAEETRQRSFLMNIPATWNTPESHNLYLMELKRLGRFLEKHGGNSPAEDKLTEFMREFEKLRLMLKAQRNRVSAREFSEIIAEFHRTGHIKPKPDENRGESEDTPIALLGGPLTSPDFKLFDIIAENGGRVVLDGTETGERTLPSSFDREKIISDPLRELARAYFESIPDAFRRPNIKLYEWIKRTFRERGVEGVILVRRIWCDVWHGEVGRLREYVDVPLLDIDLDGDIPYARIKTRIQAFMETLQ